MEFVATPVTVDDFFASRHLETWILFGIWSIVWTCVLNYPPGSKEIVVSLRLNFLHGLISTIVAILALLNYIPYNYASTATISYFFVDFINMLLNDFIFRVACYQPPMARRVEYFHHFISFM
jgi:hypothetical protein